MIVTFEPTIVQVLTLLAGFGIPVLVGLVTKFSTSGAVKAVLLAALALIAGVVAEAITAAQAEEAFDIFGSIYGFAGTFIVAVAAHFGIWKPTGVTDKVQSIGVTDRVDAR
jgi:hypothetical protein